MTQGRQTPDTYYTINHFNAALKDFNGAITMQPSDHCAYLYRGYVYLELELFESAIQDFEHVDELNPTDCAGLESTCLVAAFFGCPCPF